MLSLSQSIPHSVEILLVTGKAGMLTIYMVTVEEALHDGGSIWQAAVNFLS